MSKRLNLAYDAHHEADSTQTHPVKEEYPEGRVLYIYMTACLDGNYKTVCTIMNIFSCFQRFDDRLSYMQGIVHGERVELCDWMCNLRVRYGV